MKHVALAASLLSLPLTSNAGTLRPGDAPPDARALNVHGDSALAGRSVRARDLSGIASVWVFLSDEASLGQIEGLAKVLAAVSDNTVDARAIVVVPPGLSARASSLVEGPRFAVLKDEGDALRTAWGANPGDVYFLDLDARVRDTATLTQVDLTMPVDRYDVQARLEAVHFDVGTVRRP